MLYKLGTQENLATGIKPIWGILEKWQLTRSACSKLCLAFFLRKTSPYLNRIVFKLRYHFFNTSREWFPFSRAQHPTHRIIRFFRPSFSKTHIFPNLPQIVAQDSPGERWDWILSMFKQNKMTYQCLSRKSGTIRKSMNVLPEMLKLCFWILGT